MRPFLILSAGVGLAGLLLWRLHHRRTSPKRTSPTVNPRTESPSIVVEDHAPTSLMETQWRAPESVRTDDPGDGYNAQVAEAELVDNWIEQLPDVEPEAVQASKANTESRDETAPLIPQQFFSQAPEMLKADEGLSGASFEDQSTPTVNEKPSEPAEVVEIEAQHHPQPVPGNGSAKARRFRGQQSRAIQLRVIHPAFKPL